MEKALKTKLLSYLLISAISFAYLILPQKAGISVPVFIIIQFICLFFIVPKRKPLFIFIPIFILALNSFISDNSLWHISNFIVTIILYGTMVLLMTERLPFMETSIRFVFEIGRNIFMPLSFFDVPLKWTRDSSKTQLTLLKRVLVGVVIAIPCLIILVAVLSSADQIFSSGVVNGLRYLQTVFNLTLIFKIICGIVAGLYLFGLAYYMYQPKQGMTANFDFKSGDLIIINIVLFSVLCVYTIFAIIQFRYLFATSWHLPYGLTYTYYARRGFFELLFLSGINIFMILLILKLAQKHTGFWMQLTKGFCCYLCVMTFILLVSSFYRMWLYNLDGGLTRLRFLVLGFLVFEAIGLVFTLVYIVKPKFNIIATYLFLGLFYYLLLNLIPMDGIIAKNQVERYLTTGKGDLAYTLTLSLDAAPQIARLLNHNDYLVKNNAKKYFNMQNKKFDSQAFSWRGLNLSVEKYRQIFEHAPNKLLLR